MTPSVIDTRAAVACAASLSVLLSAAVARADEIVTLKTREGVTQSFTLLVPDKPVASVILFPGGSGKTPLHILRPGQMIRKGNFLVRIRYDLQRLDLTVAIVDVPSDQQSGGMITFRHSDEHARDIGAVVDYLKAKAPVPVWLVGTSRGTESAASLAIKLGPRIDGVILTSSITVQNRGGENILRLPLDSIRVPVLAVSHKDDGCHITPPNGADLIVRAARASPRKKALIFEGGDPPQSDPCEALSQHGFIGIEKKVAAAIAEFIKSP
ncbi:MAG: alpha/beta hydrolase [Alphaproteobacteria bacterium]|nr:alpha/beta hydrolase [Alphaproteobacteria bacterium]